MILGGVDPLLFLCYDDRREYYFMDREKLKLIIRNLELLIDSLKAEIYSDAGSYLNREASKKKLQHDYDEIFEDDDG